MESRTPGSADIRQVGVTSEFQWLDEPEDGRLSRLVRHGRLIAAGLLGVLLILRVLDVAPLQILRLWGFDLQLQTRAPAADPSPVLAVDVDDRSLAAMGQWPWPRRHLVDLVDRLSAAGVGTAAFNILFAEPDRMSPTVLARSLPDLDIELRRELEALGGYDEALARAMRQVPSVIAVAAIPGSGDATPGQGAHNLIAVRGHQDLENLPAIGAIIENVAPIHQASRGQGVVSLLPEPDGTARRVPTIFRVGATLQPGMALDIARVALQQPNMLVEMPSPLGMTGVSVGPLFVPTDSQGRLWVDTARPDRVPTVSALDVLSGGVSGADVAGRIVVIGSSAAGVGDRVRVGFGGAVSGLQFQALAVDTILTGRAPWRDPIFGWVELLATALAGLLLIGLLPRLSPHLKPAVGVGLMAAALGVSAYAQAGFGALVDPTFFSATSILLVGSFVIGDYRTETVLRRRNEAALKRHDAYIREVIDASFDAIVTIGDDARIRTANRAACALLGYPQQGLFGQPIYQRLTGPWAAELEREPVATLSRAADRPETIEVESHGPECSGTVPTEITLAESMAGSERIYILVLRDVSARRAAEAFAALSTQRLHDAVDAISDGFALFAPDGRLLRCNDAYCDMLDAEIDGSDGTPYGTLLQTLVAGRHCPAEAVGREAEWIEARLSVFAAHSQRYEMATTDGRWYQVDERRTAEGGMVCIYSDITVIKDREGELRTAMERAELASQAKSQFLANMSHELRTPLNAIIGFADMLRSQPFGPLGSDRYLGYARDISGSGSRLLKMIEQILEFARLERLQSNIDESGIDVTAAVLAAVTDLTPTAREHGVQIDPSIQPSLPALRADPQMLYQIIQNLLANAVKFSAEGSRVRVAVGLDEQRRIVLTVADEGIGIPQDLIGQITQPFWQHPDAMTSSHEGVGLGLAIVSGHVQAHDADLSVDSRLGAGTTMTVTFPSYRTV
ncbi:CHASE2 domain-containing protein [Thalassobaculum salexigens]|uniref:CHASE2 domain-containing protein n=1 Tax=Thalassobaculum salexigens TaxID=455360 RepID=UPI00248E1EE7|nr:CHASE2 domain-containing protein [Thalassobaculum salexigens]